MHHKNHNTHLQKTPKMAEPRPYDPFPMALFGHCLAKNHPTKNAIEQKYSPRARASSGHAPWRCPTELPFHGFPPALLTIFYIMNRQQGSRSGWGGWHTQQSSSSMSPPDQGGLVRWWGGGVDLHIGIDIPSHQISQQNRRFFWGGGSYVTINNGGLSIADEISFFRIFKYIRFSRPRTVWGGKATHNIMLFKQQSAIIFLEQSSSLSSHNNKHDGSLGYSNNYW